MKLLGCMGSGVVEESSYLHGIYCCIDLGGVANESDLAAASAAAATRPTAADRRYPACIVQAHVS